MYWFLGALLYFLIGTYIFIRVTRDSQSGSWILLALAAPLHCWLPLFLFKETSFQKTVKQLSFKPHIGKMINTGIQSRYSMERSLAL
ncbi:hypothetical protein BSP4_17600 [Bacillus subtilis subsp. subtilis]|nr:hypothetical protein BSP4_17600 [Bacillus subtilis subsp. subtilis]